MLLRQTALAVSRRASGARGQTLQASELTSMNTTDQADRPPENVQTLAPSISLPKPNASTPPARIPTAVTWKGPRVTPTMSAGKRPLYVGLDRVHGRCSFEDDFEPAS